MPTFELPTISNYGQYSNDNYGAHTLMVNVGPLRLYYSYKTIVAFCEDGHTTVCSENAWGITTGKHLNWIQPDHDKRVPSAEFDKLLQEALARHIQ